MNAHAKTAVVEPHTIITPTLEQRCMALINVDPARSLSCDAGANFVALHLCCKTFFHGVEKINLNIIRDLMLSREDLLCCPLPRGYLQ